MKRLLIVPLLCVGIVLPTTSCALHNGFDNVIKINSTISVELQHIQEAVENHKSDLQAVTCSTLPDGTTLNCYDDSKRIMGIVITYKIALDDALAAVDTVGARAALSNMTTVVENWIVAGLVPVPDNIKPFIVVGLEVLAGTLRTASLSIQG
jgi:hypothetical protein